MSTCDIIIPVWNLKGITERCIESIIKNTRCQYRLIIIDNGSEAETKQYLEGLKNDSRIKNYLLIRNEENLGCTKAINQGMRASTEEYMAVLNNDTICCQGWLFELVGVAEAAPDIGIVNPNSNNLGFNCPKKMSLDKYALSLMQRYKGKYIEMATAVGFCSLIKKEVVEKIGVYDEAFGMGYFDDTEYSMRAREFGYKTVFAKAPYVYHDEHVSFNILGSLEEIFKENRKLFHEKFGVPKRILYILTKENKVYFAALEKETYVLANKFNWIRVFLPHQLQGLRLAEHTNIAVIFISQFFFRFHCLFNVLVKKKKYSDIYVDDKKLFKMLQALTQFHKAKVTLIKG
ncbi:MAG: glycosyltransferase family 2 protein [Candidatus Omnitrophica bacterium]|nr:glycosyltransferase family 2 protein [Candidatus Omnitrophota bacterium]MDD5429438.1 glycosyltransferase family 2 protein [Candidatus Omnitrophota bacterium]